MSDDNIKIDLRSNALMEKKKTKCHIKFSLVVMTVFNDFFVSIIISVNSPANVRLWEEKARQEALEHAHH